MALNVSKVVGKNCIEMGVLAEDISGGAHPPKSELDSWIKSANAANTWVLNSQDPQPDTEVAFGTNVRDSWITIDLATMKVVTITTDDADASITALLQLCQ